MAFRLIVFPLFVLGLGACSFDGSHTRPENAGTGSDTPDTSNSPQAVTGPKSIDVKSASSAQCAAGGMVYSVFIDANSNSVFDSSEEAVSSQVVCNGVNGQNGSNGADGANGVNGSNGHSVVFSQVAAPSNVCAAGGSTLLMALDVLDGGVYSAGLPNQQSMTICNGADGQNGANGANGADGHDGADAPVPAFSPVEAILACGATVSYKEVLLRLANGQVLGSFSDNASGANTRLAFLPDGSYVNTDGSGCSFSLSTSGSTRSISWSGQVQLSWPVQ